MHRWTTVCGIGPHTILGGETLLKSRTLDLDPVTKVRRMFHPSVDGESFVEEGRQDVSDILTLNKELQKEERGWGEGKRVASIPLVVWEGLLRDGTANDTKKLRKWLNDPDNNAFRTKKGRI